MKLIAYTILGMVSAVFLGVLVDIYIIDWLPEGLSSYYGHFELIVQYFHNFFSKLFGSIRALGEFLALVLERIQDVIDWLIGQYD